MASQRQRPPERPTSPQDGPIAFRWMFRRDMPQVLAIEAASFEFPWSEADFVRCLRSRNCIGQVAEHGVSGDGEILGFMIYELHRNRLELLNLAVHPNHRRRGIGRAMVEKLQRKLAPQRRRKIIVQVQDSNLPAQLFFRAAGFRAVAVLKQVYQDTDDDAYLMQYCCHDEDLRESVEPA